MTRKPRLALKAHSLLLALLVAQAAGAQTVTKLIAVDAVQDEEFGRSVAIDGDYAVVGARLDDDLANRAGSAYIYHRQPDGSWQLQVKLLASDAVSNDEFGRAVSIHGSWVIVGAIGHNSRGGNSGAAYVFERDGTTWGTGCSFNGVLTTCFEDALLLASDRNQGDFLGISVAISPDTAVVGAYLKEADVGNSAGAAYVYERTGSDWGANCVVAGGQVRCEETLKLLASDRTPSSFFGFRVDTDGDSAIVGAFGADNNSRAGSAYVFERSGSTWGTGCATVGTLTTCLENVALTNSTLAVGDEFGRAVSIDGDTAVVGAVDEPHGGFVGAAYVFERVAGSWGQSCTTTGPTTTCEEDVRLVAADIWPGFRFASSVSIDGDRIVAGAHRGPPPVMPTGYVFDRDASTWGVNCASTGGAPTCNETLAIDPNNGGPSGAFGFSVSIRGDRFIVGAYSDNTVARSTGAAFIFELDDDEDDDGVVDDLDVCPDTVIPEATVPSVRLGTNRWALVDADFEFDTRAPGGKGPGRAYSTSDTAGCSCEQIIPILGLGKGHRKFGCSISAMDDFVLLVNPN